MIERVGTLYHWSPSARRSAIRSEGLKPYSPPSVGTIEAEEWAPGCGCLSLGVTPSGAWRLSGDMGYAHFSEIESWDLWEAHLADRDEIRIRAEFGPTIQEVKVYNPIPADRLWWVGTR